MASFWDELKPFGPGLLQTAADIYGTQRAGQQQKKLLQQARGPLYDTQQQMAGQSLALARGTDPKAMAAERFQAQQDLLAPSNELEMQRLMSDLQRKGMLGLSSYRPVPGTVQTPGQPLNPHVASLLAAQQGAKARSAFDSLREGEGYLDQLINRGGRLQGQAQGAQAAGIGAVNAKLMAPKPSVVDLLLKGGSTLMKNPAANKAVWDLLGRGAGMLGNWFSGGDNRSYFGDTDDNFYA